MARLTNEWTAKAGPEGDEAIFTLREATNQELNRLYSSRWETKTRGKGSLKDNSALARAELFDRLLLRVENLIDVDGSPVTAEQKEKIPLKWKNDIIFQKYEVDDTEIDVKNS